MIPEMLCVGMRERCLTAWEKYLSWLAFMSVLAGRNRKDVKKKGKEGVGELLPTKKEREKEK